MADEAALLAAAESELKFHMEEAGVPRAVQLLAYKQEYSTLRIFAGLDDSKECVRAALKKDLPLDYTASPEARKHMAQLLSVWDACRLQLTVVEKHKAEGKLGGNPRLVQTTEHAAMRGAVEVIHGKLRDRECPSKSLMAQKLEQVEDNAPEAEDLRDVTSVEDAATEAYAAVIDPSTQLLRIKPGKTMTTPPETPEELRLRHRRLGLAWEMAKSKHSTRLSEVRKHAYRYVRDGDAADLAAALGKACKAADIFTTYFIVPFTISAPPPATFPPVLLQVWERPKGKGKGKGKNNDKNDRFGVPIIKKHLKSANGKPLCQFQHACQRCLGSHPYWQCPAVKQPEKADAE